MKILKGEIRRFYLKFTFGSLEIFSPTVKRNIDTVTKNTDYSCLNFLLAYNKVNMNQYENTKHDSTVKSLVPQGDTPDFTAKAGRIAG